MSCLCLICCGSDGSLWGIDLYFIHLANGGETATFDFTLSSDMTADSYTFIVVNGLAFYGNNSMSLWYTLKSEQTQDWLGDYDTYTDLFVSKPIKVERPTGDINLKLTAGDITAVIVNMSGITPTIPS